ncbi:MAG: hypothetical protein WDM90_18570 [Ferruginibacter sp.]
MKKRLLHQLFTVLVIVILLFINTNTSIAATKTWAGVQAQLKAGHLGLIGAVPLQYLEMISY